MSRFAISTLAAVCVALTPGCSQAGEPAERTAEVRPASPVPAETATARAAPGESADAGQGAARTAGDQAGSRVLGKREFTLRGEPACEIRFIYAGREAEDLFWEEPCAAVTAKMLTQPELEALGKWDRMDGFAKKFVNALPGAKVLYVEGGFSASVYPVGTTGSAYEVPVAD